MKVVAYTCLLYGSEYLAYAARSVINHVDEWHVLYSPVGSHGHRTELPCPDTRETLLKIAMQAGGDKLRWWDGNWTSEGLQRMTIHEVAPSADVIVVLDADEIWPQSVISLTGNFLLLGYRKYKLPVMSFWRSFYRAMPKELDYPDRVICPNGQGEWTATNNPPIAHFGYAQSADVVYYKQFVHGHKGEWRKDCDWFREKFLKNAQQDVFPAGIGRWTPETVNPSDYMPDFMREHPNWNKEIIE